MQLNGREGELLSTVGALHLDKKYTREKGETSYWTTEQGQTNPGTPDQTRSLRQGTYFALWTILHMFIQVTLENRLATQVTKRTHKFALGKMNHFV